MNALTIKPNVPLTVALVNPEGVFDFEGGFGLYETTTGQSFILPRPAVIKLNELDPEAGEEIVITKHWSGKKGEKAEWTVALSPNSEKCRAMDEESPKVEPERSDPAINKYSHYVWQNYASPVWFDIDPGDTLQKKSARDDDDSRHICPLQLTVIRRAVELWSNPGDIVLSPYAGIGSEGYVSLQEGRRFVGAELKDTYYRQAVANLSRAIEDRPQPGLDLQPTTEKTGE
jgi:hypothetical protein